MGHLVYIPNILELIFGVSLMLEQSEICKEWM